MNATEWPVQYIVVTVIINVIVMSISAILRIAWQTAKDSNSPIRNNIIQHFIDNGFWYVSSCSVVFSVYSLWSRYGHAGVFFVSINVGMIFFMLSAMFAMKLFDECKRLNKKIMDWLCTVYRCPGCDKRIDHPVWPIKRCN